MRRDFFFSFMVLLLPSVSITETREDVTRNEYANRINEESRTLFPVNIVKQFSISKFDSLSRANTTNKCMEQVKLLVSELTKGTMWALKMFDASSKLSSGILEGNRFDLGMYDECVAVNVDVAGDQIRGRHCMYTILATIGETELSQTLSICLPTTCEPEHIKLILDKALEIINYNIGSNTTISTAGATCSAIESPEWTVGGIATIIGFSLLLLFLVICTVCDIFLRNFRVNLSTNSRLLLLQKFSVYSNAIRILSTKITSETLPAIQGLRFFSMCWVILGHEYFMSLTSLPINSADLQKWVFSWNSVYIMIAPFAVDTFFTISGFLMSYLFLKEMSNGRSFNLFGYYVHRYLRLTPAFAAVLLVTIFFLSRMGSGAIWEKNMVTMEQSCKNNWWHMLLYVHNYVNDDHFTCLGHTWYLAVEMQFFWISPLILYPLAKKPKIGLLILSLFFVASIFIPAKISWDDELVSGVFVNNKKVKSMSMDFYVASHNRASAWLIGIFFGYIVFKKTQCPSKMMKFIGWLLTVTAALFCVFWTRHFQLEGYEYHKLWETFYTAVSRPVWSAGVAWIIYACVSGFGGPVTKFLSLGIFHPFGRISYCTYLVHVIIEKMKISAIRVPRFFSDFITFNQFLSDFILSIVVGFAFSLVFESPILILEKMIIKRKISATDASKKKTNDNVTVENGVDNPGLIND